MTKQSASHSVAFAQPRNGELNIGKILRTTHSLVNCTVNDMLLDIWQVMKQRGVRNIPVVDEGMRAIGVLNARGALERMRDDSIYEE